MRVIRPVREEIIHLRALKRLRRVPEIGSDHVLAHKAEVKWKESAVGDINIPEKLQEDCFLVVGSKWLLEFVSVVATWPNSLHQYFNWFFGIHFCF